ncbi:MAG: Ig-like domain repeat protein [Oscillochloris sp.]|nr:Ig-like domain repeat protein [Oscillochloris sp.]
MRRSLQLLVVFLVLVGVVPGLVRGADETVVYLPLLANQPEPIYALGPEQLGVALPVATKPAAFFADQVAEPGGKLAIWLPPGRPFVRGAFFLNGSLLKPNPGDPDWRNEVAQTRLFAARQLASLWNFALITGDVWDIPEPAAHLDGALNHWATTLNRPELAHVPLAIDGGSRFSNFCRKQAAEHFPGRILACTIIVAGAATTSAANRTVPSMVVVGERDRGAEIIAKSVIPNRASGSLLAAALMWKIDHKCDRCQDLTWPYLDRVIAMRLSAEADPRNGPLQLHDLAENQGFLADLNTWSGPWAYGAVSGDPLALGWLPDRTTALIWRAFAINNPPLTITAPTQPYKWANGFSQKPSTLRSGTAVTLQASISAPVDGTLTFYDGDQPLGVGVRSTDGKNVTLSDVYLEPGMHSFWVMSANGPVSWPAGLIVLP